MNGPSLLCPHPERGGVVCPLSGQEMKEKEVGAGIADAPPSPSKERRGCRAAPQVRDWPSPCLPSPLGTFPWTKCWGRGCSLEPGGSLGSSWEQMSSLGKESCTWPGQSVEMQQPLWKLCGSPPPRPQLCPISPQSSSAPAHCHSCPSTRALGPHTHRHNTDRHTHTTRRHTHTTHRLRQHRHTDNRYR